MTSCREEVELDGDLLEVRADRLMLMVDETLISPQTTEVESPATRRTSLRRSQAVQGRRIRAVSTLDGAKGSTALLRGRHPLQRSSDTHPATSE